jgi:hypothetical protein
MSILVELIAQHGHRDRKRADDEIKDVSAGHDRPSSPASIRKRESVAAAPIRVVIKARPSQWRFLLKGSCKKRGEGERQRVSRSASSSPQNPPRPVGEGGSRDF